jgi:hypothetical protein
MASDLNIIVGVQSGDALRQLGNVRKQVDSVSAATQRASGALRAQSQQYSRTAVATNKFAKGALQQLGYQVGDFAVQVANGTSKMQAFGQQGSQLLGIFGPVGALLGAGVAIFSAIGVAAQKSGLSFMDFSTASSQAKSAVEAIKEETKKYNTELELLNSGLDTAAQLQLQKAIVSMKEAIAVQEVRLSEELLEKGRNNTSREQRARLQEMQDGLAILYAEDEVNKAALKALQDKNNEIRNAKTAQKELSKVIRSETVPEIERLKEASEMVGSSFERSMMSVVKGTATAKDAFRAMASDIVAELYRIFVVKQITGFITGAIQGAFMPREYSAPPVAPRAIGGPVSAGSPYLVGERGPELMIPSRSGTIIPNNKLGGGGGVVVNQTINVSTGVQQTVRAEIKQLMPQIADSAKAAVVDAKRRGGSYGRAFA